jgi:DNA repair protein RecO (recombination protein O)
MEWADEAIILGGRRHGENSTIVELMTRGHGRHLGLVRGGRSRRLRPVLQPGNRVQATWRARLDEHLGLYAMEPGRARAAGLMQNAHALYGFAVLAAHLRLLPERDPHPPLYRRFVETLEMLADPPASAHTRRTQYPAAAARSPPRRR